MILTDPVGHLTGQHRIEILSTIHDADADAWNRVVGLAAGSVFHTWQWLAAFEDAPPGEFEPRHIAAYQGDELVGICPAYLVHDCPRLSYLVELGDFAPTGPILLAHSLAALDGGPLAVPGHDGAVDALLHALGEAARSASVPVWSAVGIAVQQLQEESDYDVVFAEENMTLEQVMLADYPLEVDFGDGSRARARSCHRPPPAADCVGGGPARAVRSYARQVTPPPGLERLVPLAGRLREELELDHGITERAARNCIDKAATLLRGAGARPGS
ncbi:hypothetical protein SMICM304S_06064 [Streptomyces microflavus]